MILHNAVLTTLSGDEGYGLIVDGAIVIVEDKIVWVGAACDLSAKYDHMERHDQGGRLITPALIDCHTHVVHGGDRAVEFEQRLTGISYDEIARRGGGILSTVKATRVATVDQLVQSALPRVDALLSEGIATIEIKSGYGLAPVAELNMLRAARKITKLRPVQVVTTYLAAHAIPPEFAGRANDYIAEVCLPTLNAAHAEGLVDAVDGFCEHIAFSAEELEPLFTRAKALGLPVKLHAEQLSHQRGTAFAACQGAISVDHIEFATAEDVKALSNAGSVAVLLPGAYYTVREAQLPPVSDLRKYNVPIALATDCNPGSSPMTSVLLAMNMGCTLFALTPEEALRGTTVNAARALGLTDRGQLAQDLRADLAIWDVRTPAELSYRIGFNPLNSRMVGGEFQ
ncbi:MAG: imidazolonepropionase [Pseudoruegeria sp.]